MTDSDTDAVPAISDEMSLTGDVRDFRVLVVDDSEHMLKLLRGFFNALGVRQVRTIGKAEDALRLMNVWPPHLVVTDLKMRPMSGLDLIKAVRNSKDIRNPQVPIIVITGFADLSTVQFVKSVGATAILVKPVALGALREHVTPLIAAAQITATALAPPTTAA